MTTTSKSSRRDFIKSSILLLSSASSLPALAAIQQSVKSNSVDEASFDLQSFVDSTLRSGKRRIVLPRGRHRVSPRDSVHLRLTALTNVEIIAEGVEMICTETSCAISFEKCRDVRLRGMTIDYDPLPFTQGRIVRLAPDRGWFEFEVIEGYPDFSKVEKRVEIFDAASGELLRELPDSEIAAVHPMGERHFRIVRPKGFSFPDRVYQEQIGDILVTNQRSANGTGDHAIVATDCAGLKLEDVTLYASPLFGFLELRCDGTNYRRCKIDRRPQEEDPIKRGLRRLRSLNADAFHSIQATQGPAIVGCTAKFQDDDCVNIHGTYHLVTASHGNDLRVVAASGQLTIHPGDKVEFIPYEGKRPADAVAVRIEPDEPINEAEKTFVQKHPMDEHLRQRLLSNNARFFKITLDHAAPLTMGAGVCSSRSVGNGCLVQDCDFGHNRSRGILIKASNAKVLGNTITRSWMTAVLVAPEFAWWMEAACASNVLIEGNTVVGCRGPAIDVTARGGDGKILPSGAHRNIIIRGNSIRESVWPNIHVTSTDDLVVKGNHLTQSDSLIFAPPLTQQWDWKNLKAAAILVELCDQPKVQTSSSKQ